MQRRKPTAVAQRADELCHRDAAQLAVAALDSIASGAIATDEAAKFARHSADRVRGLELGVEIGPHVMEGRDV